MWLKEISNALYFDKLGVCKYNLCNMCWYNLNLPTLHITLLILCYQLCSSISRNFSKVLHIWLKILKFSPFTQKVYINPLNAELNPICHLLVLVGAHHILHVSRVRVKHCMPLSVMHQCKVELWLCLCTVQTISICSTFHSCVNKENFTSNLLKGEHLLKTQ